MRASVQSETVWPQIKMETLKIRQVILRFESSFPGLGERTRAGWLGTGYERTAQAPTAEDYLTTIAESKVSTWEGTHLAASNGPRKQ